MIRTLLATFLLIVTCSIQSADQVEQGVEPARVDPNQELLDEGISITAEIEKQRNGISKLVRQIDVARGDNKIALELQFQEKALITLDLLFDLSDVLKKQVELALDTTVLRDSVVTYFNSYSNSLDHILDTELAENVSRRSETASLKGFELIEFERSVSDDLEWNRVSVQKEDAYYARNGAARN